MGGAGANASGQEEGQRGHGPRYPFISGSVALADQNGFTMARPADVEGQVWRVEVGQPWRNERAGLKPGDLREGVEIRVVGEPSADINDKRVKAERLFLGTTEYKLYPERD